MEKLKDILHDTTDILLALVIVVAMFAVVSLYLGDWFNFDKNVVMADTPPPIVEENEVPNEVAESDEAATDSEAPLDNQPNDNEEATEKPSDEPVSPTPNVTPPSTSPVTVVEIKRITIPDGTPGVGVARILYDNGLIENTADFIRSAEDLNLSLKLKSGTFEIPTNATIEAMVKIIAKQN